MERLDRGYASQDWMVDFPQTHITNLAILQTDHAPIILNFSSEDYKTRHPYQIETWTL